jgi:hypothetical protein
MTMTALPPIVGDPLELERSRAALRCPAPAELGGVQSACAVALHMHQPLIPAGPEGLREAPLISNLQHMESSSDDGNRHNASVYRECYQRMAEFIPTLVDEGLQPRVMLEYSGTLLHGLAQMGHNDVLDQLRRVAEEGPYRHAVEWLGAPWGHAVAPSTPTQDYRRHVLAWQHHFAHLFGLPALARVRGFSPSEMALPNHPDVAFEFVKTLCDAGYEWVLVQEHTVELAGTGRPLEQPHLPHRLVCKRSTGEVASIIAIVKTQGSDTKLVGQMQPYYEAKTLQPLQLGGRRVPALVTQIADGENGGVMMNEFPSKYFEVVRLASGTTTPLLNVSEYVDGLYALGVTVQDLPALQPILQQRIWDRIDPGAGPERLASVLAELSAEDDRFHVEGGSWTNDISWVRGYGDLMNEMQRVSVAFHEALDKPGSGGDGRANSALYHLLCSQTSCFRYWGEGSWTDYGREICRRAQTIIEQRG